MKKKEPKVQTKPKLTASDKMTSFAFRIFKAPASKISRGMPGFKDDILRSNMHTSPEGIVSIALFATMIASAVSLAGIYIALTYGILFLYLLPLCIPIVFMVTFNSPRFSKSNRASALDNELSFVIGYMVVLAGGGVSPLGTLRRISGMKLFPAAAKEAKRILVDIDVFGLDPISALERAAKYSPNRFFSEFLFGYTTVLRTGGDFMSYLNSKLAEVLQLRSNRIKNAAQTISTLAEGYIAVTGLLGITLFSLFQVQALISNSSGGLENILVFSFVVVPMLSVMFIWLIDVSQPKFPFVDTAPMKLLAVCMPIGIAVYLIPLYIITLNIPSYLHVSLSLIAITIVPAAFAIKRGRERMGLERRLPDFIQDVAEGRKIGLPPERSIELLATKNYGRLSKHVQKMGSQLSWGISLNKVVSTFASRVVSWLTRVVGSLMLEVVDVGGGTMKSFIEMSNFTRKINDLEAEKRSALKPYIFVTYAAGVMVVVTTFLMAFFMSQPVSTGFGSASRLSASLVEQLFIAAIFESWVIGFVAGKMGEGSIADGFKHAVAMVVISLAAIHISRFFIALPI